MKIRNGFVSNSSSSSFCIYGISDFSLGDPIELLRTLKTEFPENFQKFTNNIKKYYCDDDSKDYPGVVEIVKWMQGDMKDSPYRSEKVRGCEHPLPESGKFCPECGTEIWVEKHVCCEDDMDYITDDIYELFYGFDQLTYVSGDGFNAIGLDYGSAPDDMTFGEFRAKADRLVSKIVGKEVKCKHICEDYYC